MSNYKVIHPFRDLQDVMKSQPNGRLYKVGDKYPATKRPIDEDRVAELISDDNKIGVPLIDKVGE